MFCFAHYEIRGCSDRKNQSTDLENKTREIMMKQLTKKKVQMSESAVVNLILALSGGCMDAYSYLYRGEVFANAQTGNMLLFGVNAAGGDFADTSGR